MTVMSDSVFACKANVSQALSTPLQQRDTVQSDFCNLIRRRRRHLASYEQINISLKATCLFNQYRNSSIFDELVLVLELL